MTSIVSSQYHLSLKLKAWIKQAKALEAGSSSLAYLTCEQHPRGWLGWLRHCSKYVKVLVSSETAQQMDPLSVSGSIIGILGAAAKVSSVLISFVQNTKAAPKLAQTVLSEVNGLSAILTHLQTYLLGAANPSRSRASLILVEQVIVTLTESVTTFSELEDALGTSKIDAEMGALDRVRWAMKESKISEIQGRLQSNKTSLNLMLNILQWFAIPVLWLNL